MESVTDKMHSMILALLSFNNTVNNTIQLVSTKYFNTWRKYFSQQKMFDGKFKTNFSIEENEENCISFLDKNSTVQVIIAIILNEQYYFTLFVIIHTI